MSKAVAFDGKVSAHVLVVRTSDNKIRTQLKDGETVYLTKRDYFRYKETGELPDELECHTDES